MHNVFGRSTRRNARKIGFLVTSSMVMAASLVVSVPIVVAFLLLQKYLVAGLTSGAVK